MLPTERRNYIFRYVHEKQVAAINDLAQLMSVSHMTIRRDVEELEKEGKITRVSGGVKLSEALRQELAYTDKARLHHRRKRDLGRYAASCVEDGQVVYLDAGTTTFEIARCLADRFHLTIITNDFSISQFFMDKPAINLFHIGGEVDKRNYSTVGICAASFLKSLNIDVAFVSSSSWDLRYGVSTPYEGKAIVKQAVLGVAKRTVLVSDSSKYGKYGKYKVFPIADIQEIITDSLLPEAAAIGIQQQGVKLHIVDV